MIDTKPGLIDQIRSRFAHVDTCPFTGPRVFFENAGGALTLNSVIETSTALAAVPDNQGRDNPASQELMRLIAKGRTDARRFLNATGGQIITGESGTELIFRLVSAACLGAAKGGLVIGSTLEHPATRSACVRWAALAGKPYVSVAHNSETGTVGPSHYREHLTAQTRVATILHTSPVTGMGVDVAAIAKVIRETSPECFIIVDGIQHAAHGGLDIDSYDIDAYVISPYKVFSRHGYGLAWLSDRLVALPHDMLIDGPTENWELGTRDTASYATFSDVVGYFQWLGSQFSVSDDPHTQIEAAGAAIHAQEKLLTDAMLYGTGNLKGLAEMDGVLVLGGVENPAREGLVSLVVAGCESGEIVSGLREQGIRVHLRKADHYSGGVLRPLHLDSCIRVSLCHYNTTVEVAQFLTAMHSIVGP